MNKKICFLLIVLCLGIAAGLICGIVLQRSSAETQQQNVEELRDQLKVYQTVEKIEPLPSEQPAPDETEETNSAAETIETMETMETVETEPETISEV